MGPIVSVVGLVTAVRLFADVKAAGHGGIFALEFLLEAGLVVFVTYAATRFFSRKTNAPSVIIGFFIASLGASALILVIALSTGARVFAIDAGQQLARETVGAAIWIPYLRVSKRVKATFVN